MTQHFQPIAGCTPGLALLIATSIAGFANARRFAEYAGAEGRTEERATAAGADGVRRRKTSRQAPRQAPPNPIIPNPNRNTPADIFSTFDANQKAQAGRVSAYLSSLPTLVGNFVQVGPDGSRTKGEFYMQKPGKVRFEYDPPSPIDDGRRRLVGGRCAIASWRRRISIRCRRRRCAICCPTGSTCCSDTNVVGVYRRRHVHHRHDRGGQALVGTSRLMLMFGAKDNQLKQWTVTDPQGYDTTVAVYNLEHDQEARSRACSRSTSRLFDAHELVAFLFFILPL